MKTFTIVGVTIALIFSMMSFIVANNVSIPTVNEIANEVIDAVKDLGASPGPTHTETQYFLKGFEYGSVGATTASTTVDTSRTLAHSDMRDGISYMELTPTIGAITLTTEATSTFALGLSVGSTRTIHVYNATTTTGAASIITWAAGTGMIVQEDEGETLTQNGLEVGRFTFIRKANTDILMYFEAGQGG